MLFRALYMRENKVHGMTFSARNTAFAAQFAYTVLQSYVFAIGGSWILTVNDAKEKAT